MKQIVLAATLALTALSSALEETCDVTAKQATKVNNKNLKVIQKLCGEVCLTDLKHERRFVSASKGRYYKALTKQFDCDGLWNDPVYDEPSRFCVPPDKIPKKWIHDFTYGGRVDLKTYYFKESQSYYPEFQVNV